MAERNQVRLSTPTGAVPDTSGNFVSAVTLLSKHLKAMGMDAVHYIESWMMCIILNRLKISSTADLAHLAADPHLARRIIQFSDNFPGKSPQFVQARKFAPDLAPDSQSGCPNRDRVTQDGKRKAVQPI